MKIALTAILLIHGLINIMGFTRAFATGNTAEFTRELSRPIGVLWLLTGLLFILSGIMILLKKEGWPIFAILATLVSQLLIFMVWTDAKYGTIANVIILIAAIIGFGTERFEGNYKKDVVLALKTTPMLDERIIEKDLEHLPSIVQKYLRYVGVVGKPKIRNVKIVFEGEMRDKGKDWFKFTSEQNNFLGSPGRYFFMKAKVKSLPTYGYHSYQTEDARMQIKLLSLFSVVDVSGEDLYKAETVTFFNDLCLFAPGALIDNRIQWEVIDEISVKATFTNSTASISAILTFDEEGKLKNFVSNDRIAVSEMKTFPFSTPVKSYKILDGFQLPTYGEAIWHYPDGEFIYGKFNVKSIEYNVSNLLNE